MNEVERQVQDRETDFNLPLISKALLAILIVKLVYNYWDVDNLHYNGEQLTSISITIDDKPEYIDEGKGGTDRYTFSSIEYKCRFWIIEGGLALINKENLQGAFGQFRKGQLVDLKVYATSKAYLNDPESRITVIGLSTNGTVIIDPANVEKEDLADFMFEVYFTIGLATLIGIVLVWSRKKKTRT